MSRTLITSRDRKGRHITGLFEAVLNKAGLTDGPDGSAQCLIENGGEFQESVREALEKHSTISQFATEAVCPAYGYPPEYKGPRPIEEQIRELALICGGKVDPSCALAFSRNLPDMKIFVPADALHCTGWFATLWDEALVALFPEETNRARRYCLGVNMMFENIASTRSFTNWRKGHIDPSHLRVHPRTMQAMDQVALTQRGGILILAVQLGIYHAGQPVSLAREVFTTNEYGTGSLTGTSIVYSHPQRLVRYHELDMDLPGDEFSVDGDGQFGRAPILYFRGKARFDARGVSRVDGYFGSSSFFAPTVKL
ncbi:MAG: hypothetical protein WC845_01405 [Candidatus Staskawiczbacteria bacterium]